MQTTPQPQQSEPGSEGVASRGARGPSESLEIELKYEVPEGAELPSAEAFAALGLVLGPAETHHLVARYFDTPDGALSAQRIAVRVREGGPDEGWHLKERGERGTRELHWPLSERLPEGLAAELRARIGDAAFVLRPIAELRTERRARRVRDTSGAGAELVEIADDRVRATELRTDENGEVSERVDRAWREWEAELLPGASRPALERVAQALAAAGAVPSASSAKVARASGGLVALARESGASAETIARLEEMDRLDREAARRLGA